MKKIKYSHRDFSPSLLPQKRSDVIKDVYKNRFSLIFKCGLMLALFAMPLIVSIFVLDYSRFGTNGFDETKLNAFYFYYNIFLNLAIIVFLYVFLLGFAGVIRILKMLIWQDGIDFFYDFKKGIKENYKVMLFPSLILTGIYLIYFCVFTFLVDSYLSYVALGLIMVIFVPLYLWYILLSNMYKAKMKDYLTNSLFFFLKSPFLTLLGVIFIAWPFFIPYFQITFNVLTFILKPIILIILFLFYYPFLIILVLLYSSHLFDKYINIDIYPDYYRRGLYNPEHNDEDDNLFE